MYPKILTLSILATFSAAYLQAETAASAPDHHHHNDNTAGYLHGRVDSHAPIGVMGDHMHRAGEFMFSYRYMHMSMNGNRTGSNNVSPSSFLAPPPAGRFVVAPTRMDMDMHMFGLMWAPTDDVTFMAGFSYLDNEMDHVVANLPSPPLPPGVGGSTFTTKSSGIGDLKLNLLFRLLEWERSELILGQGVSLPTGSISETGFVPTFGRDVVLPYPMQLGSGTIDYLAALTYKSYWEEWSWGAQVSGVVRTQNNDHDYQLGNVFEATGWVARALTEWASVSLRADFQTWGDIDGADPRIAQTTPLGAFTVPTAQPDLRGGTRVDALLGFNFKIPKPFDGIHSNSIAVEAGLPVYQYLNGPQLKTEWLITVGWQLSW
ncbi:MAG: transporter [Verrucomicrobiota bacterium]